MSKVRSLKRLAYSTKIEPTLDQDVFRTDTGFYLVLTKEQVKNYSDKDGNLVYGIEHILIYLRNNYNE